MLATVFELFHSIFFAFATSIRISRVGVPQGWSWGWLELSEPGVGVGFNPNPNPGLRGWGGVSPDSGTRGWGWG